MTRYQLLLLPALAGAILVLGGALHQKSVAGQHPALLPAAANTDPQALALLDRAIEALSPERVAWLEATIWQQVRCDEFVYQACGRLLTAPGERMRFDVNVKVGKTQGELRMVCDGVALAQTTRIGENTPVVARWELPGSKDAFKLTAEITQSRRQLLQDQGFVGMTPLLGNLRKNLGNSQCQQQIWKGCEVFVISGAWPEKTAQIAAMPDLARPRLQPRLCCVYLDAQTLWPHRLEWWGSEKAGQPNSLLAQTEFRNPVLNRKLPPQQCAAEFAIQ
jgi:hypothetical protein